ncbi:MAG TPA: hypothetical protein VMG38_08040 [Trebonia sp.]|nr:hypothetical protein [Trebonia sp.]
MRWPDSSSAVSAVADAILYEGYLLYPYRKSAGKNRLRWQFGVLAPRHWAERNLPGDSGVAGSAESWFQQTECLLEPSQAEVTVALRLRFLHGQRRTVEEVAPDGGLRPVRELEVGGRLLLSFDEAVPLERDLRCPLAGTGEHILQIPGWDDAEDLRDADGRLRGRVVRRRSPITVAVRVSATRVAAPFPLMRLTVRTENVTAGLSAGASREEALTRALLATHTLIAVSGGSFVSLLDPPQWAAAAAGDCSNIHTMPVLAGEPGRREEMLSSPIILYDYPRVAPESPGDLFDAGEIDEILSLRALTLTEAEKREARATDPRAAQILDRVEAAAPDVFARLHGTIRSGTQAEPRDGAVVIVAGTAIGKGSRVRLRPRDRGTDAHDMFLAGRHAVVEDVLTDVDGSRFLAVSIEDDPAADLQRILGRFFHFSPDEVEPAGPP